MRSRRALLHPQSRREPGDRGGATVYLMRGLRIAVHDFSGHPLAVNMGADASRVHVAPAAAAPCCIRNLTASQVAAVLRYT